MNLSTDIIDNYFKYKNKMNAAYTVFKKNPSIVNAAKHTEATNEFNTFCTQTLAVLVGDVSPEGSDKKLEILANFDDYKTCKQCNHELLFSVSNNHYIASGDFLEDFPGWCYTCLVEHCQSTDCETCAVSKDTNACSFKGIKEAYTNTEE